MPQVGYVSADYGGGQAVRIDLADFDTLSLGMLPDGANVYHEFAKQRLQRMGVPALLVEMASYSVGFA